MRDVFLPPDPAMLRKQADLYRRLAGITRNCETAARLAALAERCQAQAEAARESA
jgi:hypothetical protein